MRATIDTSLMGICEVAVRLPGKLHVEACDAYVPDDPTMVRIWDFRRQRQPGLMRCPTHLTGKNFWANCSFTTTTAEIE